MAIYWPTPGLKGKTFKLFVLTRWDFNFCVRSSQLRGFNWAFNVNLLTHCNLPLSIVTLPKMFTSVDVPACMVHKSMHTADACFSPSSRAPDRLSPSCVQNDELYLAKDLCKTQIAESHVQSHATTSPRHQGRGGKLFYRISSARTAQTFFSPGLLQLSATVWSLLRKCI